MGTGLEIIVTKIAENQVMVFQVIVKNNNSQTEHKVSLNRTDHIRLTKGHIKPEVLLKKSFEFLLEQEPKEDLLKEFDFTAISRYYPNFLSDIQKRVLQ